MHLFTAPSTLVTTHLFTAPSTLVTMHLFTAPSTLVTMHLFTAPSTLIHCTTNLVPMHLFIARVYPVHHALVCCTIYPSLTNNRKNNYAFVVSPQLLPLLLQHENSDGLHLCLLYIVICAILSVVMYLF